MGSAHIVWITLGLPQLTVRVPSQSTLLRQAQRSLCHCGVPDNLNLSGIDLGSACNPGPTLDSSPAEQPGA